MFKRVLAAVVIAVAIAGSATAGPLEDADAAYKRGDYATALSLLRPLAESGDASAQSRLGAMYDLSGPESVPRDYAEAAKWYRLAAEQGDADAQNNLGVLYEYGHGVPQDDAEAAKWYRLAADQNNASAQEHLGFLYAKGQGVPQDYAQAHIWFDLAAAQGNETAIKNRDVVAGKITPDQLVEAQRLAREWKPKAALNPLETVPQPVP